jgi:cytochrome c oxidase subunit IV
VSGHASEAEIKKHVKIYISVFVALAILTVVTVAVSYWDLALVPAVALALAIASVKSALVACFFMHLISEKQIIISILALTAIFLLVLLVIPTLA